MRRNGRASWSASLQVKICTLYYITSRAVLQRIRLKKLRKFFKLFLENLLTNAKICDIIHTVAKDIASRANVKKVFEKKLKKLFKNLLTNPKQCDIITKSSGNDEGQGSIAQLGEHLPYKQRVTGSSPVVPTIHGPVVQLVRTLACHARGQGFESPSGRHFFKRRKGHQS